MVDTSWMVDKEGNPRTLGESVEALRVGGNRLHDRNTGDYGRLPVGECFYRVLHLVRDLDRPFEREPVLQGWSNDAGSFVMVESNGEIVTLNENGLGMYQDRRHWVFVKETQAQREAAAQRAFDAVSAMRAGVKAVGAE